MERLGPIVSCMAFNKDGTQAVVGLGGEEVYIYAAKPGDDSKAWERKHTLTEHGGFVSGVDWSHVNNQIVTCGHDRNAYVWKLEEKSQTWKPTLVILRINRAATAVKWSPLGNKFAVSSGAKCVAVCSYEKSNDWWVSKLIKKHKSTVSSLAWCANNKFLVTGCCDNKCRVFSAYIEGLDSADDDGFGAMWPAQHTFGEPLAEYDCNGWVNAVSWSPNKFRIAFAGHDSTVTVVQLGAKKVMQTIYHKGLPFMDLQFLSDKAICAVGFDCTPTLFTVQGGSDAEPVWKYKETFDKGEQKAAAPAAGAGAAGPASPAAVGANAGGAAAAREMFKNMASKGSPAPPSSTSPSAGAMARSGTPTPPEKPVLITRHANIIQSVIVLKKGAAIDKVCTSSLDGRVLYWDLAKLKIAV